MSRSFHLDPGQHRFGWNHDVEPALVIPSGAQISVEVIEASAGQIGPTSDASAIASLDFARVNPVSGPVYVEGARPGDVLQVDILDLEPSHFGWTAQIPGFGLLADEFPDPWLCLWEISTGVARFRGDFQVPVRPMCGVLGVAPAEAGTHSVVPPRRVGGNMDIAQLGRGATVYLPIAVEGALFGVGDTHAAQGDGEVCGTAIETSMFAHLRLSVRRDLKIEAPQFEVEDLSGRDSGRAFACTGIGPDLMQAARDAVRAMITHIQRRYHLDAQEAYAICSVAVSLRISEIVNAPNWVITAFLPESAMTHR